MLRIENLVMQYKTGDIALKHVNLEIPKGQVLALIGPSGAGKSTLIRCVNRLVQPTSGKIYLDDLELTRLGSSDLRKARCRMGMIFQEYALVERLSVMENVLSGRLGYVGFWRSFLRKFPQSDIDAAFHLLERVGLDHMLVFYGLSPKLGPVAEWGLDRVKNQIDVDTEKFQTNIPGVFAIGDIIVYPGKKKLILSGFHEAALVSFAVKRHIEPEAKIHLQYTTTSSRLHERLGVK